MNSSPLITLFPLVFTLIILGIGITIPIIGLVILNKIHKTLEKIEEKTK